MSTADGMFRIGKTTVNGEEVVIVEMLGVTLAHSRAMVQYFDSEPDFTQYWTEYFAERFVEMVAERMHQHRPQGWTIQTRLSPPPPKLPREGEEQ